MSKHSRKEIKPLISMTNVCFLTAFSTIEYNRSDGKLRKCRTVENFKLSQ